MQRIILTTGGTGGHIFPALSVAEALKKEAEVDLLFVGSLYGPEKRLCAEAGLPFTGFPVRGFLGRGLRSLPALWRMLSSFVMAVALEKRWKPAAVAGFGGYASFAPMLAARVLAIPRLLHEQNAIAGMSNRFLGKSAQRICLALPHTVGFPSEKCVVCGNPVREAVVRKGEELHVFGRGHLLILGGSQGAHALNTFMIAHLAEFKERGIAILHQTGPADEAMVKKAYCDAGYAPESVTSFISDMPKAYAWADLVLCRSGASTIAELCAMGLPSVLVPFPFAVHDHQTENARVLAAEGAAVLLPEAELESNALNSVLSLLSDPKASAVMGEKAKSLARVDAAKRVAREILALAQQQTQTV